MKNLKPIYCLLYSKIIDKQSVNKNMTTFTKIFPLSPLSLFMDNYLIGVYMIKKNVFFGSNVSVPVVVFILLFLLPQGACQSTGSNKIASLAKNLSSIVDEGVSINDDREAIQKHFLAFEYIKPNEKYTLPYRLYLPDSYKDTGDSFPLLIFLHGSGERGRDNQIQISINTPFELLVLDNEISKEFPCIIAAPQCPNYNNWSNPLIMPVLLGLIDTLKNNLNVDTNRIYITGLSMGGYGTFDIIAQRPDLFAAGMPICGGSVFGAEIAGKIKDIPIWVFHAADDDDVPVRHSRDIVMAIENLNGKHLKYTEYETGGHSIWFGIYSDPDNIRWLFDQKK